MSAGNDRVIIIAICTGIMFVIALGIVMGLTEPPVHAATAAGC